MLQSKSHNKWYSLKCLGSSSSHAWAHTITTTTNGTMAGGMGMFGNQNKMGEGSFLPATLVKVTKGVGSGNNSPTTPQQHCHGVGVPMGNNNKCPILQSWLHLGQAQSGLVINLNYRINNKLNCKCSHNVMGWVLGLLSCSSWE